LKLSRTIIRRILAHVTQAHKLACSVGIGNLLQPGLVKEMIIADLLGHALLLSKRAPDACDANDTTIRFEYLSCKEGGSGQFDRMFKEPREKRARSLERITRNQRIYLAVFLRDNQIQVKEIYELDPAIVVRECERQLDRSRNVISHVGLTIDWAAQNGKIVYRHSTKKKLESR